jgi:hypothetical protein
MCLRIARSFVLALGLASGMAALLTQTSACTGNVPRPIVGHDLDTTPCSARVSKGPWSLSSGHGTANVRWESCLPQAGSLSFLPEVGGETQHALAKVRPSIVTLEIDTRRGIDHAGTFFMNDVRLEGLAPSTCYAYRIDGDPQRGRVCTARAPGEPLTFAAIGDTNPALGHTQALAARVYPAARPDFTLHAGDMQYYEAGLESWAFWFPAMSQVLLAGPLLPARGNHEREEPNELEEHFRRYFHDAGARGLGLGDAWSFSSGGIGFFGLDTESDFGPGSAQAAWLERMLATYAAQPGYRFSVIVMHRPFVTCGDSDDHDDARAALAPPFRQHRVALVLQGHQHGYERFEIDGTTYVTTGGGGARLQANDTNLGRAYCGRRVAAGSFFEVEVLRVVPGALEGVAIDEAGVEHDAFRKPVP